MHPTTEFLTDFIDSPAAGEFDEVRNHLINCKECRFEANRLSQFKANLIDAIPYFNSNPLKSDSKLQQSYHNTDIEAYVDGALNDEEKHDVGQLLQNNKSALKSALHYATHEATMAASVHMKNSSVLENPLDLETPLALETPFALQTQSSPPRESVNVSDGNKGVNLTRIRAEITKLFEWRPSAWLSIPVTAVAVFTLSVLLLPQLQNSSNQNFILASYQDAQLTHYKQAKTPSPGIGFFSNTGMTREAFDNIKLKYLRNDLYVNWPVMQDDPQYTFSLYENVNNQRTLLATMDTKDSHLIITDIKLQPAQHYIWELKGQATDQSVFSVSGGFVTDDSRNL